MRCDQFPGLSESAKKFLETYGKKRNKVVTIDGIVVEQKQILSEKIGMDKIIGMYEMEHKTTAYELQDGSWVHEFVQCEPWSSGPMYFLALKRETGEPIPETYWTEEEIQEVL